MSAPLVVCVPNFSEGRRPEVIEEILSALRAPGVRLVHHQADAEHNRLDTTIVGAPDAVRRAVLAAAERAVALIDLDRHSGGHPRMGAVDVVPFVPLADMTMEDAIDLARSFAEELASRLSLPVYCYDRAAFTEERRSLAEVRRGEYEGVRDAVARGERLPDFGPNAIGPAGATAVGARKPLIAFNLYLDGDDEDAAKRIAREIRESSGGLPAVRAIGFAVPERGCVTVSMNLVDHDVTPPRVAFAAVERLARAAGMEVRSSEIVGLVPRAALSEADITDLRLEGFDEATQLLERVVNGTTADTTLNGFLDSLASDSPTPGGGAAAAVAAAAGASLIAMVGALTQDKAGYEAKWGRMRAVREAADDGRLELLALADRDGAAFELVMDAFAMPKADDASKVARADAIQRALRGAAEVPLEVVRRCAALMPLAREAVADGNVNAVSDGLSAGELLAAGARCAAANVGINAASLKDRGVADALTSETSDLLSSVDGELEVIRRSFADRIAN